MADLFAPGFVEQPYWWDAAPPGERQMALPARTGVAIVGGGYTGLSAALTLRRLGHDVTVIDAERIGWGASSRNGGMVSGRSPVARAALAERHGAERADAVVAACTAAFPFIEETIAREAIDCDYVRSGRFTGACSPRHMSSLAATAEMLERTSGMPARIVPKANQREVIGSDFYHGGMLSDGTGSLHPGKYARGLAAAAERAGVTLVSDTRVGAIARDASGFTLATNHGTLKADAVLTAVNGYALNGAGQSPMPWLARRLVPVASYLIATEELPPATIERLFPRRRMMGETRRVLNYFRPSPDGRRVIWGGRASFRGVTAREAAPALHRAMAQVFPELARTRLTHAWFGNVAFTFDHLPHIGVQDGIHYAAGCQGSGVAMATWLGHNIALKLAGASASPSLNAGEAPFALDGLPFPTRPFYRGNPAWVLPFIGNWYRLRDRIDRLAS